MGEMRSNIERSFDGTELVAESKETAGNQTGELQVHNFKSGKLTDATLLYDLKSSSTLANPC